MTATLTIRGKMYDGSIRSKMLNVLPVLPAFTLPNYSMSEIAELFKSPKKVERQIDAFFKKIGIPVAAGIGILTAAGHAFKAHATSAFSVQAATAVATAGKTAVHMGLGERLMPLIHMVQELALPIGIVVASWGMIEMIMGNIDAGKHKLKWAIIGFCGMFLIPEIFFAIRDAFSGLGGELVGA